MSEVESGSSLRCGQRWLRLILWFCAVLVVVLCALPIGIRYGAEYWLNDQPNMSARIGDVDLNLFNGTIKVKDFELHYLDKQVLAAQKVVVKVIWLPLLQHHFYVEKITLEEGVLWLTQAQGEPLVIAGFSLSDDSAQQPPVLEPAPEDAAPQWGVHSGQISLKKFQLRYQAPHVDMDVVVNRLAIDPIVSWRQEVLSPFSADIVVNGGGLNLEGTLSPFAPHTLVDSSLQLTGFELNTLAPLLDQAGVSEAAGRLDCAVQLNVKKADDEAQAIQLAMDGELKATALQGGTVALFVHRLSSLWAGKIEYIFSSSPQLGLKGDLSCTDVDLDLLAAGLKIEQKEISWQGTGELKDESLSLAGNLSLSESAIQDLEKQRQLLKIAQLDLKGLAITGIEQITSDRLELKGLHVFQRSEGADSTHSIAIEQTSVVDLALRELNQLHVAKLHLAGLNVDLNRTVSGALDLQEWFSPAQKADGESVDAPQSVDTDSPFTVQCGEIVMDQGSQVRVVDSTMEPPLPVTLGKIELQIADLDSSKPQQPSPLTFTSMVGRYANLDLNGHIKPFMQPIGLELVGSLREFNVTTVSPYSEKNIGYQLQQGQLNLDFTLPIADGMMALDSDIYLKQFRLQALSAEDEANASKGIGLPVNLALSLLRDRDGDIHLQLPVKGDLNDPNLHIGPIIRSALLHTLHNTVMLPLAPLGIVSKAGEMIGLGNALSFERVVFEPGTAVMAPPSQEYLANVAKLLSERSQLTVAVCGRFTEQDHDVFMLEEKDEDVLRKKRRELAEERAVAVKEQLLQGAQVEAAQLLLCRPTATVISGVAGVDLTLQ